MKADTKILLDEKLREAFADLLPEQVDTPAAWSRLVAARRQRAAFRRAAVAAAAVVLLAVVGWAVWRAIAPSPELRITDDTLPSSTISTTPASDSTTPASPEDTAAAAEAALLARLDTAVTGRTGPAPEMASFVWPSGTYWGLWAGNVETIPEKPAQLPADFYQEPLGAGVPLLPDFITASAAFKEPSDIPEPLWVFADEVDIDALAPQLRAARDAGRPICIVGITTAKLSEIIEIPLSEQQAMHDEARIVLPRSFACFRPWAEDQIVGGWMFPSDYWVQPPKEPGPVPTAADVYDSLARTTLSADLPAITAEERTESALRRGSYFGFWAGNVETIPERPKSLPAFFYSGPTPSMDWDGDHPSPYVDATKIKQPLWVFCDEVNPLDYREQIGRARQDNRPVIFYAYDEEEQVIEALGGLGPNVMAGSSSTSEGLRFFACLPWGDMPYSAGSSTGEDDPYLTSPEMIFQMMADNTLLAPMMNLGEPREKPLSTAELADLLRQAYRGITLPLFLPSDPPEGFVVAESYSPGSSPGGASAKNGGSLVVDNPRIEATWYGVRYARGEESFWLLVNLDTAPADAAWEPAEGAPGLPPITTVTIDGLCWVHIEGSGVEQLPASIYFVGEEPMKAAMIEAAAAIVGISR